MLRPRIRLTFLWYVKCVRFLSILETPSADVKMPRSHVLRCVSIGEYVWWHTRLLDGDPEAPSQLATKLLRDVPPIVRARWHGSFDALGEMADDAIVMYLKHPQRFDPHRGVLPRYVAQAVINRLKNWQRHECTQHRAEARVRRTESEFEDSLNTRGQLTTRWSELLNLVRSACTPIEQELLWACVDQRGLPDLAAKLGLQNAPRDSQEAAVSRARARIVRRLKRRARKLGL